MADEIDLFRVAKGGRAEIMAISTDLGTAECNLSILLHSGVILTTQEEGSGQAVEWVNSLRPWADPSLSPRTTTHGAKTCTYAEPMIGGKEI
jgi:hypothetical protein